MLLSQKMEISIRKVGQNDIKINAMYGLELLQFTHVNILHYFRKQVNFMWNSGILQLSCLKTNTAKFC